MSNNKQTAVEQFIEQLEEQGHSWENASIKTIEISIKVEDYLKLKQQAKEMEKLKAFEIFKAGQDSMEEGGKGFEQYYEQTYGGNK